MQIVCPGTQWNILAEAVLTLRDMTSDAQTPLAHATMLRDTSGFQWHMPKTCDISMDCVLCHIVALRVAPSVVTDTCRWVPLHNVDCVTQARQNDIDLINSLSRSSIRFIASRNSFVQQIFLC